MKKNLPQGLSLKEKRYIVPPNVDFSDGNGTATAGRVYLSLFDIRCPILADQISLVNGTTAAGNITVGIYGPLITEDTCFNSPLAANSASTAQAGTSRVQNIPLTSNTLLGTGRYYVAIEFSSASATYLQQLAITTFLTSQRYDRSGGYGALTDPCPVITSITQVPLLVIRNIL